MTDWPSARHMQGPYSGVISTEVTADESRAGHVDDGNIAWPERVEQAKVQWPQADVGDFEPVGRRGWVDRASGAEYRALPGAPLLDVGSDATRDVVCFLIADGKLHFLEPAGAKHGLFVNHGEYFGGQIVNGQIVKEGTR